MSGHVQIRGKDDAPIVQVFGEFDENCAQGVLSTLTRLGNGPARSLVLDITECKVLDRGTLPKLIEMTQKLHEKASRTS